MRGVERRPDNPTMVLPNAASSRKARGVRMAACPSFTPWRAKGGPPPSGISGCAILKPIGLGNEAYRRGRALS